MTVLYQHWYVGFFVLAEVLSLLLMRARLRALQADLAEGIRPLPHPSMQPVRGWRLVELVVIVYHFPLIVPTAWIRRDDRAPAWAVYGVTPVLYSAIAIYLMR